MSKSNLLKDRIKGCIVGGAIGDAYGGVRERGRISISDDTQLTLATCEAIVEAGCVSPEVIARNFVRWFREGRVSCVGSSTLKALRDLDAGAHWALAGAKGERTAGNGAAMRIASLAFMLDPLDESHRVTIRDVCRITHHNDEAYCGALAVLIAVRSAALEMQRQPREMYHRIAAAIPDSHVRDRLRALSNDSANLSVLEIGRKFGATGFVAETVPLAIVAAMRMTQATFEAVVSEIVEIGGDADTIASIAGQIAGARLGFGELPQRLIAVIPEVKSILKTAEEFGTSLARRSAR